MLKRVLLALFLVVFPFVGHTDSGKTVIKIHGHIDGDMLEEVQKQLDDASGTVEIRINSPGGEVGAGLLIIRAIRDSGLPTVCIVEDLAASMAADLLESPACHRRVAEATSVIMFHPAYVGEVPGNKTALETAQKALRAVNRSLSTMIAARIGMSPEDFEKLVANELWLVGEEALAYNMLDEITPVSVPAQQTTP